MVTKVLSLVWPALDVRKVERPLTQQLAPNHRKTWRHAFAIGKFQLCGWTFEQHCDHSFTAVEIGAPLAIVLYLTTLTRLFPAPRLLKVYSRQNIKLQVSWNWSEIKTSSIPNWTAQRKLTFGPFAWFPTYLYADLFTLLFIEICLSTFSWSKGTLFAPLVTTLFWLKVCDCWLELPNNNFLTCWNRKVQLTLKSSTRKLPFANWKILDALSRFLFCCKYEQTCLALDLDRCNCSIENNASGFVKQVFSTSHAIWQTQEMKRFCPRPPFVFRVEVSTHLLGVVEVLAAVLVSISNH